MFTLPPSTLAKIRLDAQSAMQDTATIYDVSVTRDLYGNESVVSGVVATHKCYIGSVRGEDTEIVERLKTSGRVKRHTATLLLPYNAEIEDTYIVSVSGVNGVNEWDIVWSNQYTSDAYRVYVKCLITRDTGITEYKDRLAKRVF